MLHASWLLVLFVSATFAEVASPGTNYYGFGDKVYYNVYRAHQYVEKLHNENAASFGGSVGFLSNQYTYTDGTIMQDCIEMVNKTFDSYQCCNSNYCGGCTYYSGSSHNVIQNHMMPGRCYQIYPPSDAPCYSGFSSTCDGVPGGSCGGDCVGWWYSFGAVGECAAGVPLGTGNCTWRASDVVQTIQFDDLLLKDNFISCVHGTNRCNGQKLDWKSLNTNVQLMSDRFKNHAVTNLYNPVLARFSVQSVPAAADPAWQCRAPCPPGSYSTSGFLDAANQCLFCPIGTYAANKASTVCLSCPAGRTTSTVGATSSLDCKRPVLYEMVYGEFSPMTLPTWISKTGSISAVVTDLLQGPPLITSTIRVAQYCFSSLSMSAVSYQNGGGNVANFPMDNPMAHSVSLPSGGMCGPSDTIGGLNQCTWKIGDAARVVPLSAFNGHSSNGQQIETVFSTTNVDTYIWNGTHFSAAQSGLVSSPSHQCQTLCPTGMYSVDGFAPCTPCPINTYANTTGSLRCNDCPKLHETRGRVGAKEVSECLLPASRTVTRLGVFSTVSAARLSGANVADTPAAVGLITNRWYQSTGIVAEFCANEVNVSYSAFNYCYGTCCSARSSCPAMVGATSNPATPVYGSTAYGNWYSYPEMYECAAGTEIGSNGCSWNVSNIIRAVDLTAMVNNGFVSCHIPGHHPPSSSPSSYCWNIPTASYDQNTAILKNTYANATAYILVPSPYPWMVPQMIAIGHDVAWDTRQGCTPLCPLNYISKDGRVNYPDVCSPCPAGTYTLGTGATVCTKCSPSKIFGSSPCGLPTNSSASSIDANWNSANSRPAHSSDQISQDDWLYVAVVIAGLLLVASIGVASVVMFRRARAARVIQPEEEMNMVSA